MAQAACREIALDDKHEDIEKAEQASNMSEV
jgi:hypothetical protein